MAFQRSNWTRTASAEHARVYSNSAIATGNITGNGGATTITLTVPWQFQGNGQIDVSIPPSTNGITANSAAQIGVVQLIAPSSTTYSGGQSGNHPRVQLQVVNVSNANVNIQTTTDLILVQY